MWNHIVYLPIEKWLFYDISANVRFFALMIVEESFCSQKNINEETNNEMRMMKWIGMKFMTS